MSTWYYGIQFNMVLSNLWWIPFKSSYVQANTFLNSFKSLNNWYVTIDSSVEFTFTRCTLSLAPKLILVNWSSSVIVQPTIVIFYIRSWAYVSSTIISPTSRWKKVPSKCYLIMSGGIANFTVNTPTSLTWCFGIGPTMTISGMYTSLGTSLVWISIVMVPNENMSNSVANITSSFSSDILEWKS